MLKDAHYISQMKQARQSADNTVLSALILSPLMRVRRALARNPHLDKDKVNLLALDPVLNVSYLATQHPNCTVKREFEQNLSPCITCDIPEHTLHCHECERK